MRYGEFKRGIISKTEGQVKKHYSQMSKEELMFLQDRLHNLNIKIFFIDLILSIV